MKEFIVRLFSLLAIVGVLFGYNEVLDVRAKDEEIAKLNAQLEVQSSGASSDSESGSDSGDGAGYKDGTYTGEADGFGGTVAVEVTVKDGKIEAVEVTSAEKEDSAYLAMAEDIIPKIKNTKFQGILISITNPADVVGECLRKALEIDRFRCFSTGTSLDSLRIKRILEEKTGYRSVIYTPDQTENRQNMDQDTGHGRNGRQDQKEQRQKQDDSFAQQLRLGLT